MPAWAKILTILLVVALSIHYGGIHYGGMQHLVRLPSGAGHIHTTYWNEYHVSFLKCSLTRVTRSLYY